MVDENPLVKWSFYDDAAFPSSRDMLAEVDAWLDGIARELERPKPKYPHAPFVGFPVRLLRAARERAEALFPRVWHAGGTNAHDTELGLLSLVGFTADPASIPFWKDAIALSKVRDRIASKRRATAAAALAFTALRHPGSGAFETLDALTRDEHPDACAAAVDTLAHLAADEESPLARPALEILRRVARDQGAFATRFIARRFLVRSGEPLPPYEAADAIAFEVTFGKCHRTVELAAEQTLEDLHLAILDAFGWDTDHLHQFSLSGDLRDERFTNPGARRRTASVFIRRALRRRGSAAPAAGRNGLPPGRDGPARRARDRLPL